MLGIQASNFTCLQQLNSQDGGAGKQKAAVGDGLARGGAGGSRAAGLLGAVSANWSASLALSSGGGAASSGGESGGGFGAGSLGRNLGGCRGRLRRGLLGDADSLAGAGGRGTGPAGAGLNLLGGGGLRLLVVAVAGTAGATNDVDTLPLAGAVAVDVLADSTAGGAAATSVVDNRDALVDGQEGSLVKVGVTTSPLNGALWGVLATSDPCSELDLHGSLWEGASALGISVGQSADDVAIDNPVDSLGGPVDGVGVERGQRVVDGVVGATIIRRGVTLAEVVGLDLEVITANPLPINLPSPR